MDREGARIAAAAAPRSGHDRGFVRVPADIADGRLDVLDVEAAAKEVRAGGPGAARADGLGGPIRVVKLVLSALLLLPHSRWLQ